MKKFVLCFSFLAITLFVMAQERAISGKVTAAEDGTPLPGVNVVLKGTTNGAVTDADGNYKLSVSGSGGVLVFSFIGLKTSEIEIGDRSVIDIALSLDVTQLSDIVVSGVAGATSREKLTVSVTKIGAERLNNVTAFSLATSLSGKVAGIRISNPSGAPGGNADVLLRADNNLNNVGSSPLIMIDGMIMTGSLADINADDVESMEVIKGAAASALYGSRAGNGVIYIKTKRGSSLNQGDVRVNVRNEIGIQEVAHTVDLAEHHAYTLASDWESFKGQYTKFAGVTYPAGYSGAGYHPGVSGNPAIDADHYMDNPYGVTRDQQDLFFNTGTNATNFISVASRSSKSSVYASFENMKQEGIITNTDGYKRQNFRVNYDLDIAPWLRLSTSNLFINTYSNSPGAAGTFFDIVLTRPDADLNQPNPDGQPYYLRMDQFSNNTNPLYQLYKPKRENTSRRWLGNYALNVEFTDWANLDFNQSIEIDNSKGMILNPKDTWTGTGGTAATFGMSYTNGALNNNSTERITKNTQVTLNLAKRIGDLSVKGKLSYLYEDRSYEYFRVNSSQFVVEDVPTFENFNSINDAFSEQEAEIAQNYFAILGLDYKDKILFDGMYRYDGSSLFGSGARWNPYFRLSGGYRISQDIQIPGINELKIRAAYGTAGIRPDFNWQYETYSLSNGVTSPSQRGNTLLKPSQTAETEIGLNVTFLKNFTFEGVYAQSKTTDQFLNVPLIPFLNDGYNSQYQNAGTTESKTIEMTLGAKWIDNADLKWNSNIVFSRIRTTITELPIAPYVFGTTDGGAAPIFYVKEGETYGSMYGYTWVRSLEDMAKQLGTGETISDYELNSEGYVIAAGTEGTINERAIKMRDETGNFLYTKIGNGNANFNMGVANTLTYKGIFFYFLVDIKSGGDVYNSKNQWLTRDLRQARMDMSGVDPANKKAYDYWVNFYDVNTPTSYWVEDGSFVKIRELAVGYSLPKSMLSNFIKGAIKGVNLKFVGRNLYTFTDYSGYDPEVGTVRQPYDGIGKYPNFRNYAVSLSLDF